MRERGKFVERGKHTSRGKGMIQRVTTHQACKRRHHPPFNLATTLAPAATPWYLQHWSWTHCRVLGYGSACLRQHVHRSAHLFSPHAPVTLSASLMQSLRRGGAPCQSPIWTLSRCLGMSRGCQGFRPFGEQRWMRSKSAAST